MPNCGSHLVFSLNVGRNTVQKVSKHRQTQRLIASVTGHSFFGHVVTKMEK